MKEEKWISAFVRGFKRKPFYREYPLLADPRYAYRFSYQGIARPMMLHIEPTNICPNNCIIFAHSKMKRKKGVMPVPLFEKTLQQYTEIGGGSVALTPMIGEAFLDPLLLQRLHIVREYPRITYVCMTTNALGLEKWNDDELREILTLIDEIKISVYGLDEEEYAKMTQRNTYHRMVQNIGRIARLSDDMGESKLRALGFRPLKSRKESEYYAWIEKNAGRSLPFGQSLSYANWGGSLDTQKPLPFDIQWEHDKKTPLENKKQCVLPALAVQVYIDGSVSFCPCCDFDGNEELSLGNIEKKTLKQMYNSKKSSRLWRFEKYGIPKFCENCTFYTPIDSPAHVYDYMQGYTN